MVKSKWFYCLIGLSLIFCIVLLPLLGTGCSKSGPETGGTIKIIKAGSTDLSGGFGWITGFGAQGLIYVSPSIECLVYSDKDGQLVPHLATSWDISKDGLTITFNLRQGVKFHDDTDFNADAVKFTWDQMIALKKTQFANVTSVAVIDNYTIRVNFKQVEVSFMSQLSAGGTGFIISPAAYQKYGVEGLKLHPVGTGPFKFVSYQPDVSLVFEKFEGYWQNDEAHGFLPRLQKLEFDWIADYTTATAAFLAGEADIIKGNDATMVNAIMKAHPEYQLHKSGSLVYVWSPDSLHTTSPLSNVKVRKAVAYAIDNQAIAEAVGQGLMIPTNQYCAPSSPWYDSDIAGYPYNPTKAKQLLTEAGYPSGFSISLYPAATSGATYDVCVAMAGYLKNVGITATVESVDTAKYTTLRDKGWNNGYLFTAVVSGAGSEYWTSLVQYMGDLRTRAVSMAYPSEVSPILKLLPISPDKEMRKMLLYRLSEILVDQDCTAMPTNITAAVNISTPYVQEFDLDDPNGGHWAAWNLWKSSKILKTS